MSLDVYLVAQHNPDPPRGAIYVRREGRIEEVSREEWDELYPDREPVVATIPGDGTTDVYWANITHNLGKMAGQCEIDRFTTLYDVLWRPETKGWTHARDLVGPLKAGLAVLNSDRERLEQFNPENGWGDYEGLCKFTSDYLGACELNPEAELRVSR